MIAWYGCTCAHLCILFVCHCLVKYFTQHPRNNPEADVPTVWVRLLQLVKPLQYQGAIVAVQVEGNNQKEPQSFLLESDPDAALRVQD